jgi:hypothetical protein
MAWRQMFLNTIGPGLLGGISMGDWIRLLAQNRFAVSPRYLPRATIVTAQAIPNSLLRACENFRFRKKWEATAIAPPVFLLGHWRSGTTHLHNLLTVDKRFAFPNTYQCIFPHTFLTTEAFAAPFVEYFIPKTRAMDNVKFSVSSAQEDEFALCLDCFKSPFMGWLFPNRQDFYQRYLTFEEASHHDIQAWNQSLTKFLQKLIFKYGKPIVLKSPPHTARVAMLLNLFPDAKFVHIHRNPYDVYQSSIKTFMSSVMLTLQRPRPEELEDRTLQQYARMYDAFFEQRKLIPTGNFHEMSFEDLERDPIEEVRKLYEALSLPDFGETETGLRNYVATLAAYRKNEFRQVPVALRERIGVMWRRSFDEWGYDI